jgi:hypothetical protein
MVNGVTENDLERKVFMDFMKITKRIVIEFEDVNMEEIEDINISFRDNRPYTTRSEYETKDDGSRISRSVVEPVACFENAKDNKNA